MPPEEELPEVLDSAESSTVQLVASFRLIANV